MSSSSSDAGNDIFNQVVAIISEQLGVAKDLIKAESSFSADLDADSLDTVELLMLLEEKFGIEIPDTDAEQLLNVQSVVDYIEKHS